MEGEQYFLVESKTRDGRFLYLWRRLHLSLSCIYINTAINYIVRALIAGLSAPVVGTNEIAHGGSSAVKLLVNLSESAQDASKKRTHDDTNGTVSRESERDGHTDELRVAREVREDDGRKCLRGEVRSDNDGAADIIVLTASENRSSGEPDHPVAGERDNRQKGAKRGKNVFELESSPPERKPSGSEMNDTYHGGAQ